MKKMPKPNQRETVAGKPAARGNSSSRRRFIKQTLAAGVAGGGIRPAECQTAGAGATKRAKPHKSPPGKQDHTKELSKDLKKSMEWDFERFLHEIVEQINKGKTTKEIEDWIRPANSTVKTRQIVKADVADDGTPDKKDHPLGVCLVAPIEWKMDGKQIVGFTIRGRMGRKAFEDLLDCEDYPPMDQTARRESPVGAFVVSRRSPGANRGGELVYITGGSSSSSSSSSSWPP